MTRTNKTSLVLAQLQVLLQPLGLGHDHGHHTPSEMSTAAQSDLSTARSPSQPRTCPSHQSSTRMNTGAQDRPRVLSFKEAATATPNTPTQERVKMEYRCVRYCLLASKCPTCKMQHILCHKEEVQILKRRHRAGAQSPEQSLLFAVQHQVPTC